jgi:hypothetical protein
MASPDAKSGPERRNTMATTTPDSLERVDFGPVEVREAELDGYTVNFLHFNQPVDMSVLLRGLPGDVCHCPHWGVVTEGRMSVRYADHEEVVSAGDVFYMAPGHVPTYDPGTRMIQFSPSDELAAVDEAIQRNMASFQAG